MTGPAPLPPADPTTTTALRAARYLTRLAPGRADVGEVLGATWEAAARHPANAFPAAVYAALGYVRDRDQRRRRRKQVPVSNCPAVRDGWTIEHCAVWGTAEPAAPVSRPAPAALWADARPQRAGWTWRQRVMVYLMAVEGWALADVARCWGVSNNAVSKGLAPVLPAGALRRLDADRKTTNPAKARKRGRRRHRQRTARRLAAA